MTSFRGGQGSRSGLFIAAVFALMGWLGSTQAQEQAQVLPEPLTQQPPQASIFDQQAPAETADAEPENCLNSEETSPGSGLDLTPGWSFLPSRLLWQPPLASPRAPRMFVKSSSLKNGNTMETIDTAIGGEMGLFRYVPEGSDTLWQIDLMAGNFSRWSQRHLAVATDYRFGFPITFRSGPWQGKFGYEHTSTHLGDDFIERTLRFRKNYIRDELVTGLSYRWWNALRLYGEAAYAAYIGALVERGGERFAWGVEYSKQQPTGWAGQPFGAFDMDLRPEQNWHANNDLQLGWQWIPPDQRMSLRFVGEYYNGNSPFGQFMLQREHWISWGFFLDVLY